MKKFIVLLFAILFSCSANDDDLNEFNVDLSEFREIEVGNLDYFFALQEIVSFLGVATRDGNDNLVLIKKIGDCGEQEVETCFDLENLDPASGFQMCVGFYGYNCYDFLVIVRDGETDVISSVEEYRSLVGEIDKLEEALFILRTEGYWIEPNKIEMGAYKEVADGFEIIATRMISDCAPIVVNRYHFKISLEGEIRLLAEEEYSRVEDLCI